MDRWMPTNDAEYAQKASMMVPPDVHQMVMHSRQLERVNMREANKFLKEHPHVVLARQMIAHSLRRS